MAEKPESGFVLFQEWVKMDENRKRQRKVISLAAGSIE